MSNRSIYDKNLQVMRPALNLSLYSFMISELVQKLLREHKNINQELKLLGENIGPRLYEIISFREKSLKRETKFMNFLQFIVTTLWKNLFGKHADALEKALDSKCIFYIKDCDFSINQWVQQKNEDNDISYNLSNVMVGVIKSILVVAGFNCEVYCQSVEDSDIYKTEVFEIEFDERVIEQDEKY